MPAVLRFGISSLDELLGLPSEKSKEDLDYENIAPGIYLPSRGEIGSSVSTAIDKTDRKKETDRENTNDTTKEIFTTSVCIIGPTGSGKSIFGLHMASRYLADCIEEQKTKHVDLPAVLYLSTDLTYNMANRAWKNFALNYPFARSEPFSPRLLTTEQKLNEIVLKECNPTSLAQHFDLIETERDKVIFVDMAAYTAGDDWGFLHKLLSLLPAPNKEPDPRHLVVIDAIEGFEALAREVNAFGEESTRRARIAQVMRLIAGKCHVVLVIEQGKDSAQGEKLAEEFVADTVLRLDNVSARNYERRVLKVEKVRGQSHIRGHHHYSIRSGNGSTTGNQVNPDDPRVDAPVPSHKNARQSYVQVFHSVHRISRKIMEEEAEERLGLPKDLYAAFGIKYLDNMLGGSAEIASREERSQTKDGYYYDTRGLPCRSTTALIGDSLTQKSTLGKAFLSRAFNSFSTRLEQMIQLLENPLRDSNVTKAVWSTIRKKILLLSNSIDPINKQFEQNWKDISLNGRLFELVEDLNQLVPEPIISRQDLAEIGDSEEALRTHLGAWLLDYQSGVAVMLVTHNTHYEELADEFIGWLHSSSELNHLKRKRPGYREALRNHIKGGTICRRLEIHSLSSEVLVHIVKQAVHAGQRKILTVTEMQSAELRYSRSWPIRLVIDDFSSFRDIFPELREDPLLFPSILFHFEREGVTTLIVDTQSGKPEITIAERFESELRQMVHHHLYTWRVPFYGESRVAITAIPPLCYEYAGIVRELRWESEQADGEHGEPATVDPHFELYTGLEEGKPEPVPLHARFYSETPAMEEYITLENNFLGEIFSSCAHPSRTGPPAVIFGMPPQAYGELRALAYLQKDTRLDHTFLFQVDEYWTMRRPGRQKRAGAFQPQWSYLNATTASSKGNPSSAKDYQSDLNSDPYDLFQVRNKEPLPRNSSHTVLPELRRRHFYEEYYRDFDDYERLESGTPGLIDRVPFSWDFGFLLCQKRAWQTSRTFWVENQDGSKTVWNVAQVWNLLTKAEYDEPSETKQKKKVNKKKKEKDSEPLSYVSWRVFIEACKKAAEEQSDKFSKPITAFDFAQISPESFSSLILEMWFSEIYDSLGKKIDKVDQHADSSKQELDRILGAISKRQLFLSETNQRTQHHLSLLELVEKYWLELYKSFLILIEVINFSDIIGESSVTNFELKSKNTDFCAIASRHWYKTASQCPDEIFSKEPLVAVRLPGRFSVRGDWFLAASGSSRSFRQAERALDLLNSRRSNVTRLQLGIGLPTRVHKLEDGRSSLGSVRTKLTSHQHGQESVEYETFLKIAAQRDKRDFYWLWRSGLDDYAHCNRIWHRWLNRTLLWWYRNLLRYRSVWRNSFEVYDVLTNEPPQLADFAPKDDSELESIRAKVRRAKTSKGKQKPLKKYTAAHSIAQLKVRMGFMDLRKELIGELKQASENELEGIISAPR